MIQEATAEQLTRRTLDRKKKKKNNAEEIGTIRAPTQPRFTVKHTPGSSYMEKKKHHKKGE